MTTTRPTPALAEAFADALRRFREAAEDMEELLLAPGLADVRRAARPWRRHIDLALGTECHTTADETAAALAGLVAAGEGRRELELLGRLPLPGPGGRPANPAG